MVVFEIGLGEIAMKMRLADTVELTINGTLEQREERFDDIGVMKAASADVLLTE